MTDDWMDDDVAIGSMDSEEEEGSKTDKEHVEKIEDKVVQKFETKKSEEKKAPGIDLPITEMTDDWMDDGAAFGSIDSEDEDVERQESKKEEDPVTKSTEEAIAEKPKPSGIDLPITEMTDDWMDDDVAIGSIDSEDEDIGTTNAKQEGIHQTNLALSAIICLNCISRSYTSCSRA